MFLKTFDSCDSCVASYGLDPTYYSTCFTQCDVKTYMFELLTDINMIVFIERDIRGGLSQCSNRYARANK